LPPRICAGLQIPLPFCRAWNIGIANPDQQVFPFLSCAWKDTIITAWLAKQVGKNYVVFTNYCNNKSQPSIRTLTKIAAILHVDIRELLTPSKPKGLNPSKNLLNSFHLYSHFIYPSTKKAPAKRGPFLYPIVWLRNIHHHRPAAVRLLSCA
jgi:transcriptional regulator with XRE-family HTH domain